MITEQTFTEFTEAIMPQIIADCEWPVPENMNLEWEPVVAYDGFFPFSNKAFQLDYSVSLYKYMAGRAGIYNEQLIAAIDAEIEVQRDLFNVYYKAAVANGQLDEDDEIEADEEHDQWFEDINIDFNIKLAFYEKGNTLGCETADECDLAKESSYVIFIYDISVGETALSKNTMVFYELDGEVKEKILDKVKEIIQAPNKRFCNFMETVDLDGENLTYNWEANIEIKPEIRKILSEYTKSQARSIQKENGYTCGYLVNTVNNYTFTGWWEINN